MDDSSRSALLSRRHLLSAGAIGTGALWVAPLVMAIGMSSAHAASGPPDGTRPPGVPGDNRGRNSGNNPGRGRGQS